MQVAIYARCRRLDVKRLPPCNGVDAGRADWLVVDAKANRCAGNNDVAVIRGGRNEIAVRYLDGSLVLKVP